MESGINSFTVNYKDPIRHKGRLQKKTGYLVKSCKKVGGGLVQIIIFNVREKVTNYQEGGASGLLSLFNFIVKSQLFTEFSFKLEQNPPKNPYFEGNFNKF